jgi:hypothetical protein
MFSSQVFTSLGSEGDAWTLRGRDAGKGTEPTPEQLQSIRLKPHEVLPKWNYTISPNL